MNTIEKIARELCNKQGLDPDALVSRDTPHFVAQTLPWLRGLFYIPQEYQQQPLWQVIAPMIRETIEQLSDSGILPEKFIYELGNEEFYSVLNAILKEPH